VLAAWGLLDFPSALARMHAATKSASLGLGLIALGAGVAAGSWALFGIGALVAAFLFVTAPISGHMVGRAAYLAGRVDNLVYDDLADSEPSPLVVGPSSRRGWSLWRVVAVILVWMLLWRDVSLGTLLGGAAVACSIELLRRAPVARNPIRWSGLAAFAVRYVWLVFSSNSRVAWEVVTPSNELIQEAVVAVRLTTNQPSVALLIANAISYTPGSLTIELTGDPFVLYVHVLHFESVEQVERDVRELERLAKQVFRDTAATSSGANRA
jgi:monovalent cation/proton antiporter MnhG/PhaG subunit